ncbi:hypothetical protein IW139_003674, partial [Coemansia sp. RSA 353]
MVAGHPFHVAFEGIATHLGGRSSSGNDGNAPADGEPDPIANRVAEPDNADSTLADEITKYVYSKRTIYNNNAGIEENIDAGYTYSELDNYRARTKPGNGLTVLSEDTEINEYLGAPRRSAPDAALAVSATSDNLDLWPPVWDQLWPSTLAPSARTRRCHWTWACPCCLPKLPRTPSSRSSTVTMKRTLFCGWLYSPTTPPCHP